MVRPIIIDTDPGIDDALAIMLAAASPEVEILGITAVAGNVGLEHTSRNAAALADLLRLDCPVGRGASGPLWRRDRNSASEVHGDNGFGGYELPSSSRVLEPALPLLVRLIESSAEPVTVVAIGPMTNIALLINEYPETARKVERFVIMGGGTQFRILTRRGRSLKTRAGSARPTDGVASAAARTAGAIHSKRPPGAR